MDRMLAFFKRVFLNRERQLRVFILPVTLMLIFSIMAGLGLGQILSSFRYNRTDLSGDDETLGITKMDAPEGITNIALFGIDARNNNFVGLSDSIMIISVDSVHNCVKIVSVMRDSLVKVDGYGYQKINAAYNVGGAELAIKTLNQTFDMNIRHYATVDFVSMADIINTVGGIEAELTAAEVKNANTQIKYMTIERGTPEDYIEEPGKQILNGIQAVAWARVRKVNTVTGTSGDMGRTERQRLVMHQLFDKALAMDVAKYPAMIKALLPCMETNLSYADIFELAGLLAQDGLQFKEERIPSNKMIIKHGMNVAGLGSCMYYNLDYAAEILNAFIYDDISFDDYIEENGVDYTSWFAGASLGNEEDEPEAPEEEPTEEPEEPTEPPAEEPEEPTEPPAEEPEEPTEPPAEEPEEPTEPPAEEPEEPTEPPVEEPDEPVEPPATDPAPEETPKDPAATP